MNGRALKTIAACIICLPLAGLLALQAASSVSTRMDSGLALSLWSGNGSAREQLSFQRFTAIATKGGDRSKAAAAVTAMARNTLLEEALAPKAFAILAMAEQDPDKKRRILDLAYQINRRDLALLGQVLEQRAAKNDYNATIEVLDQILRVHPEYETEFFPVLLVALEQSSTHPQFADLLDGSVAWHERFLMFASRQPGSLRSLAALRMKLDFIPPLLDQELVAGLVSEGEIGLAQRVVSRQGKRKESSAKPEVLDWSTKFPPLDWKLVDEPGFRGEIVAGRDHLVVSARPGKGGPVAQRIIANPRQPVVVGFEKVDIPVDQLKDVGIQLACLGNSEAFFDERLSQMKGSGFRISAVPDACPHVLLSITARAWSGRSALSGSLGRVTIKHTGR